MSLRYGILGLLNYSDRTAYSLDKAFKSSMDYFWHAQTSQIYREVATMEKEGLLTSTLVVQSDKPNKKILSITEKGKEEFLKWINAPLDMHGRNARNSFLVKVYLSGSRKVEDSIRMLQQFEEECKHYADSMEPVASSIKKAEEKYGYEQTVYWKLTADFGRRYTEMSIQWAQEAIRELEKLK